MTYKFPFPKEQLETCLIPLRQVSVFHWLCFWNSDGLTPTAFLNVALK